MTAYYNEKDPFAAAWLRNLIAANMIAPGDVDERDIQDVVPVELLRYTQVHLFAGIGVWSYSMRRAGWPDNRRGWSCSCPCQPFSQAGGGAGFADERHLWPAAYHLIGQCEPDVVLGEQVASPNGIAWVDLVQNDMEARNYTYGALVTPAAGYGAPHIRHRTYWVAYRNGARLEGWSGLSERGSQRAAWSYGVAGGLPDATEPGWFPWGRPSRTGDGRDAPRFELGRLCDAVGLADANGGNASAEWQQRSGEHGRVAPYASAIDGHTGTGPVNGAWNAVDWLRCRDDKWRPVEPGTFPLVNGAANRVGLLRGYGNAIVAPQAEEFIRAAMEYAP